MMVIWNQDEFGSWHGMQQSAKVAVCWLHGLGASADDFKSVVDFLAVKLDFEADWYLPQAPNIAVTINGGMVMPAWYDIYSLTDFSQQDLAGMNASAAKLSLWFQQQIQKGISPNNIIFVGFSQGGALALYSALSGAIKAGNILGLSTYLPAVEYLSGIDVFNGFRLKLMHGKQDEVITAATAVACANKLSTLLARKIEVEWFDMGHSLSEQQLQSIVRWFNCAVIASEKKS